MELPLDSQVVSFGSWMGGDREGNPAVTAEVTRHVAYLSRWIAADLYLREVDALRFELSMSRCSDALWKMVRRIAEDSAVDIHDLGWEGDHQLLNFSAEDAEHLTLPESVSAGCETVAVPHELPMVVALERKSVRKGVGSGSAEGQGMNGSGALAVRLPAVEVRVVEAALKWLCAQAGSSTTTQSEQEGVSPLSSAKRATPKKAMTGSSSHNMIDDLLNPIQSASLHEGSHPYRLVLGDVRQKLVNTKRHMEALLLGSHPEPEALYTSPHELRETLLAVYASLKDSGGGIVADGRLLDVIRRINCFGLCLMKMDIRQEAEKHVQAMDEITSHLEMGSYRDWREEQRIAFLTKELGGRRPLIPTEMPMTSETRDLIETFVVTAELGPSFLGAYVVSKPLAPSDILLVELFQREASFMVARQHVAMPKMDHSIRVVPMFETLHGLETASEIMKRLFQNPWYRQHIRSMHDNAQEVMLGYSDCGKDACRLSVTWALYKCQEQLVELCREQDVALSVLYGRGGCMGRGGGTPLWLAVQSQPPGAIRGRLRMVEQVSHPTMAALHGCEQGEMVQAKFGVSAVAEGQLEICSSAALLATLCPSTAPRDEGWRQLMETMSADSRSTYRAVVDHARFQDYFHHVTPELELSTITLVDRHADSETRMNIAKTIPWIFSWTQTRHVFPSWLGFGDALEKAIEGGNLKMLQEMYTDWPLFHSTVDLIEMILAKVDTRISDVYDDAFVSDAEEMAISRAIFSCYVTTVEAVLKVTGHSRLCDHNPLLRHLLSLRSPFLDPINILQVQILSELRAKPEDKSLRDALMITINGIAAGMRNTG